MKIILLLSLIVLTTCSYENSRERLEFIESSHPTMEDVEFLLNDPSMDIEQYGHQIVKEIIETKDDSSCRVVAKMLKSERIKVEKLDTSALINYAAQNHKPRLLLVLLNDKRFHFDVPSLKAQLVDPDHATLTVLAIDGRFKPSATMMKNAPRDEAILERVLHYWQDLQN